MSGQTNAINLRKQPSTNSWVILIMRSGIPHATYVYPIPDALQFSKVLAIAEKKFLQCCQYGNKRFTKEEKEQILNTRSFDSGNWEHHLIHSLSNY